MNYKLFGDHYDLVSFDLQKIRGEKSRGFSDLGEEGSLYYLSVRFDSIEPINNSLYEYKMLDGLKMRTGIVVNNLETVAKTLSYIITSGLFPQIITNRGFVFDSNGEVIDEIRWDHIFQLIHQPFPEEGFVLQ